MEENNEKEKSGEVTCSDVNVMDFKAQKELLDRYDLLYLIEEKITSKNVVSFRTNELNNIIMNIVRSKDDPEGIDFELDDYAILTAFKKIGAGNKFIDTAEDKQFLCNILNNFYKDKEEEFKALYERDNTLGKNKVRVFCDVDYQNYSIADTICSALNGLNNKNMIDEAIFINPTIDFDDGFSTYIVFMNDKNEITLDGEEKDEVFPGVFLKLPVISKPKIEINPAVFMGKKQCLWITKGFKINKKGKEKNLPLDEWIRKNIMFCLSKADIDISINVNQRLSEKKEASGFLSDKYKDMMKHAVDECSVSKASREGIIDDCLNSPNVFVAAIKLMDLVNKMDCKLSKKEKIARSAGHIIGHSAICSSCLSEKEEDDD